jgi:SAM-dependent MidA family methyltransferase
MVSLTDRLRARIQSEGAISFHDFMTFALYDEEAGYYYRDRQRWGRAGDYRTSPERSVLFAATFANYFSRLHKTLGSPAEWTVFEAGGGSGVFAEGLLETLRLRTPEVFKATRYLNDERSTASRKTARERLERFGSKVAFAKLSDLKSIPVGIIFSNELLDAFPVHRVKLVDGELVEFFVKVNTAGQFVWSIQEPSTPELQSYFAGAGICLAEEQIAEVNLEARNWIRSAIELLGRGYVVSVDYGAAADELFSATDRPQGTLRSFHKHQFVNDVLANPGEQDITSSVNWSDVINAGESAGLKTIVFERQDQFLMREGLLEELELRVSESAGEAEKLRLRTSAREMILPGGMAADFQVLVQEKS